MANCHIKIFLLCCFVALTGGIFSTPSFADDPITRPSVEQGLKTALLVRPDVDSLFWDIFEEAMQAAADDLGVQLQTLRTNEDTITLIQIIRKIAASDNKPDAVFFHTETAGNLQIIKTLNKQGIDVFNINTGIPDWEKPSLGLPREKYKHWVGEFLPDDNLIGRDMAAYIQQQALKKGLSIKNKVYFLAITGVQGNIASDKRVKGLMNYRKNHSEIVLQYAEEGNWRTEKSYKQTSRLLQRYPQTHAIWAVSGETAIGAVKGVEKRNLVPGKDVVIVCTDWLPEIIQYVQEGKIDATFGGHFIDGAWALILAYDYKNGYDIAENGSYTRHSKIRAINQSNVELYAPKLANKAWKNIDFRSQSKTLNPDLKVYNFDVLDLMKDVN